MKGRLMLELARADLRNTLRDPMLQVTLVVPFLVFGLLRFAMPELTRALEQHYGFSLVPYYPLIISVAMLLIPLMAGMVMAFIMLDELDDRVFSSLAVLISTVLVLPLLMFNNLVQASLVPSLAASLVSSLIAPIAALYISGYAENKITGLTLSKASGILMVLPVLYHMVEGSWISLVLVVPTVPSALMVQALLEGRTQWKFLLVISLLHQVVLMLLALRYFSRKRRP